MKQTRHCIDCGATFNPHGNQTRCTRCQALHKRIYNREMMRLCHGKWPKKPDPRADRNAALAKRDALFAPVEVKRTRKADGSTVIVRGRCPGGSHLGSLGEHMLAPRI